MRKRGKRVKVFFDTEFYEDGKTIDLMSIGMVREDGNTLYLLNRDCDWRKPLADKWHCANTIPHLPPFGDNRWVHKQAIARQVQAFCGHQPEIWGYYSSSDWVVLYQLFGRMTNLPDGWPKFCRDFKQLIVDTGFACGSNDGAHDALQDALWLKKQFERFQEYQQVK